jgi:hypothetical protein
MTLVCIIGFCFVAELDVKVTPVRTVAIVAPCQEPQLPLIACEP